MSQKKAEEMETQLKEVTLILEEKQLIESDLKQNEHKLYSCDASLSAVQKSVVNAYNSMKNRRIAEVEYFECLTQQELIRDELEEIDILILALEKTLQEYHEKKI